MTTLWCAVWVVITAVVMMLTKKYYLPIIDKRINMADSKAPQNLKKEEAKKEEIIAESKDEIPHYYTKNKKSEYVYFILCLILAAIVGFFISKGNIKAVDSFKIILAFAVLSCSFITDMEYMIIPNLCPVLLISGRIITIIIEFIFYKDEALQFLINSLIAMVAYTVGLLIMAKITKGGIGMGDIKLFGSLGFLCGVISVTLTLILALFLCTVISTAFLVTKKKSKKDLLPLGPFTLFAYGISTILLELS